MDEKNGLNVINHFVSRLEKIEEGLSDDDTLGDFMSDLKNQKSNPLTEMDWEDIYTLFVGNFYIQKQACMVEDVEVIERHIPLKECV